MGHVNGLTGGKDSEGGIFVVLNNDRGDVFDLDYEHKHLRFQLRLQEHTLAPVKAGLEPFSLVMLNA